MKTKEFIEKVEALGFRVETDVDSMLLVKSGEGVICDVSKTELAILDTDSYGIFKRITNKKRKEILSILVDYALTDPEDREEEKRYRLRLDVPILTNSQQMYYFRYADENGLTPIPDRLPTTYQTTFTESEIAEMDITGFEPEEVE